MYEIDEQTWESAATIGKFLQGAASLTECQSSSTYATFGVPSKVYLCLLSKCSLVVEAKDSILKLMTESRFSKIKNYGGTVCSDMAITALVRELRFCNDLLQDADILRRHVEVESVGGNEGNCGDEQKEERSTTANSTAISGGSFIRTLLDEDSLQGRLEDEVLSFLRNTSVCYPRADQLKWWKLNEKRFTSITKVARNGVAVETTSVPSESSFSLAVIW